MTLSNPTGATLSAPVATGTILNDDTGPGRDAGWVSHASVARLPLTVQVSDSWSTGFDGELLLTNNTGADLTAWTIQFDDAFTVTSMWDGTYVGKTANTHTVSNPTWGGYVLANGTTGTFGFEGGGTTAQPTNLKFNGQLVGSGGTPYAAWAGTYGLPPGSPLADTEGDGSTNIMKFLFCPNPAARSHFEPTAQIRSLTVAGTAASWFCLIVDVNKSAADAEYRAVASSTPGFGGDYLMILNQSTDLGNGWVEDVWLDTAPLRSSVSKVFARVEARMTP